MEHSVAKLYPSSLGKGSFNTNFKFPIKKQTPETHSTIQKINIKMDLKEAGRTWNEFIWLDIGPACGLLSAQ